jgi:hypothetical protein
MLGFLFLCAFGDNIKKTYDQKYIKVSKKGNLEYKRNMWTPKLEIEF